MSQIANADEQSAVEQSAKDADFETTDNLHRLCLHVLGNALIASYRGGQVALHSPTGFGCASFLSERGCRTANNSVQPSPDGLNQSIGIPLNEGLDLCDSRHVGASR